MPLIHRPPKSLVGPQSFKAISSCLFSSYKSVDLHFSKAQFSLDPYNLQLDWFLGLGALFCCSFFCSFDQPCKTLQKVQLASYKCLVHISFLLLQIAESALNPPPIATSSNDSSSFDTTSMEGNERTEPAAGKDSNVPDEDGENNAEPHSTHTENDTNCHVPSAGEELYCKVLNKFKAWNFIGKISTQRQWCMYN